MRQINLSTLTFSTGRILKEGKTRFLCTALIEGQPTEVFIPLSCKLSQFFNIDGKDALFLKKSMENDKSTSYQLFAIKMGSLFIPIEGVLANRIGKEYLSSQYKTIESEVMVEGYKADLYVPKTKTIYEVKCLLSDSSEISLPNAISERAIKQLEALATLAVQGYRIHYLFVCYSPKIKQIRLIDNTSYAKAFSKALSLGMKVTCLKTKMISENCLTYWKANLMLQKKQG